MNMFDKILIANRGEIAVRIARTAKRLGVATVAVYSDADADSLHVEVCDEAYHIGNSPATESYLCAEKILQVARSSGAQAIHPGYGFLSENAGFCRSCEAEGIVFIGPPASAIEAMGSKSQAKSIMQSANVPLVPGYHGDDQSDSLLDSESRRIGYPQLIKAVAGGGGKGMRVVNEQAEFESALVSARREASSSFGDDRVLIERYLTAPRHVEVQVFADTLDNQVHLFERDCSIQRRHQKVLEEAPAPGMTQELRTRMGEAAINCARAIGYVGAGTVEFLLDEDGSFYFMEMNTRLQVEHPVTEMITGLDLVEWQLRIAAGEALPLTQDGINLRGHALEARIYAEVPERDFMPATGRLAFLVEPDPGSTIRIDTGVRTGDEVGIHYDPMIAKLIVHAENRQQAISKMRAALNKYQILGVHTNINLLSSVLAESDFVDAHFDTGFIDSHYDTLFGSEPGRKAIAACIASMAVLPAISQGRGENFSCLDPWSPWQQKTGWRLNQASGFSIRLSRNDDEYAIRVSSKHGFWCVVFDEYEYQVKGEWLDNRYLQLEIDSRLLKVPTVIDADSVSIWYDQQEWRFARYNPMHAIDNEADDGSQFCAPMPGNIIEIPVAADDTVKAGQTLIVMEAMKMEHSIVATQTATVNEIFFEVGDQVEEGERLITLVPVES